MLLKYFKAFVDWSSLLKLIFLPPKSTTLEYLVGVGEDISS
jgi:hypothetical protein